MAMECVSFRRFGNRFRNVTGTPNGDDLSGSMLLDARGGLPDLLDSPPGYGHGVGSQEDQAGVLDDPQHGQRAAEAVSYVGWPAQPCPTLAKLADEAVKLEVGPPSFGGQVTDGVIIQDGIVDELDVPSLSMVLHRQTL